MQQNENARKESWLFMSPARSIVMLLMFLIACAIIANLIRLKHLDPSRKDPLPVIPFIGFFAIMGLFGAMRGGATLDPVNRRITRWWGPFFPIRSIHIPFDEIRAVQFGPSLRPGYPQAARHRDKTYHAAVRTNRGSTVICWRKSADDVRRYGTMIAQAVGCTFEENPA
jgi:hypothetical protein